MSVFVKGSDGRLHRLDDDTNPVFPSPFYTHPDFVGETICNSGEASGVDFLSKSPHTPEVLYSPQEPGQREESMDSPFCSFSSRPGSPYPFLFDFLFIGSYIPGVEDKK